MAHTTISPDAARYLLRKMKRPNVVVYRDVFWTRRGDLFIPRVRASDGREPGRRFEESSHSGVTVWVEKDFLAQLSPDEAILIGLNRGLIKSLGVEVVSERISQLA